MCPDGTPDAKRALLSYRTLATREGLSLLAVTLLTGRSHQIRVQLAAVGHPVAGDEKYGPKSGAALSEIALHAAEVSFEHPVRHEPVRLRSAPPPGTPWDIFAGELSRENVLIS